MHLWEVRMLPRLQETLGGNAVAALHLLMETLAVEDSTSMLANVFSWVNTKN